MDLIFLFAFFRLAVLTFYVIFFFFFASHKIFMRFQCKIHIIPGLLITIVRLLSKRDFKQVTLDYFFITVIRKKN